MGQEPREVVGDPFHDRAHEVGPPGASDMFTNPPRIVPLATGASEPLSHGRHVTPPAPGSVVDRGVELYNASATL